MISFVLDILSDIEFRVYLIYRRQARKNKVTIENIEAFMKHVFRAVDRFRIVIFTLHAIDGEVRIWALLTQTNGLSVTL